MKCWVAIADGLLDAAVDIVRENNRTETQRSLEWIERQYRKIHASLDAMDKSLGEQVHCMGVNYSLADIALGCALGYLDLRFTALNWRAYHANLTRHFEKMSTRQSFINTAPVQTTT